MLETVPYPFTTIVFQFEPNEVNALAIDGVPLPGVTVATVYVIPKSLSLVSTETVISLLVNPFHFAIKLTV